MLSEVFGIFSGGVGIISVVLSLFMGFERFRGGEIFSGCLIFIFMCMGRLKLSKGGYIFRNWDFLMGGWLDRPGYFKGVENFSDGVRVF